MEVYFFSKLASKPKLRKFLPNPARPYPNPKNGGLPREVSATKPSVMPRLRTPLEANRHSLLPEFKQTLVNRGLPREVCATEPSKIPRLRSTLEANRHSLFPEFKQTFGKPRFASRVVRNRAI